jgi:hypothetical protein
MHPIANPPLPQIASELRADAAFQITRTAERLGFTDYSDVLAEVANAVTRKPLKATGNSCNATPMLVWKPTSRAHPGRPAPMPSRRQPQPSRINSHPKSLRSRRLPSSRAILRRLSTA